MEGGSVQREVLIWQEQCEGGIGSGQSAGGQGTVFSGQFVVDRG